MNRIIETYQLNRIVFNPIKSLLLTFYLCLFVYPKAEKRHRKFFEAVDSYKGFNKDVEICRFARNTLIPIHLNHIKRAEKILKVKYF